MATDEFRARYLSNRVLTATPAQRVVMLYDRLGLDLGRAQTSAPDPVEFGTHVSHALQIVAELRSSLDLSAGGPADNLDSLYGYLLRELMTIMGGAPERLPAVEVIVNGLRDAWAQAAEQIADPSPVVAARGAWVS